MTVSNTDAIVTAQGNGITTEWPFSFNIPSAAGVRVVTTVVATGIQTTIDAADYTVTGLNDPNGGTITYPTVASGDPALTSATSITIYRSVPQTQLVSVQNQTRYDAGVVESVWDRLTMMVQDLNERYGRAVHVQRSDTYDGGEPHIPIRSERLNKVLGFDANGDTTTYLSNEAGVTEAAASAAAALVSETAAALSATNAATSETNAGDSEVAAAASAAIALAATVGKYQSVITLTSVDSPYTLGAITENTLINATTTGGSIIINLPASAGLIDGILVGINKIGATNTVTVNPNGADTIGSASSFVQYDDTEWSDLYLNKATTDWLLGNLSFTSADEVTTTKTGSTIKIKDLGVDTAQVADNAIDPSKAKAGGVNETTTARTFALTDNLNVIAFTNATASVGTIPTNSTIAHPVDETRLDILCEGAGGLTITAAAGVTLNGVSAGSFTLTQWQGATLIKRGTDAWTAPNQTVA